VNNLSCDGFVPVEMKKVQICYHCREPITEKVSGLDYVCKTCVDKNIEKIQRGLSVPKHVLESKEEKTLEPLPCPFCGKKPEIFDTGVGIIEFKGAVGWNIKCRNPECYAGMCYESPAEAIRVWNKRV